MENLGKVLLYLGGLVWLATECILLAEAGAVLPLIALFGFFAFSFVILGCWPAEDATINRCGTYLAMITATGLIIFGLLHVGTPVTGPLRLVGAIIFAGLAFLDLKAGSRTEAGH